MKVTFNWLRQYVAFDGTAEELAERLTMLGLEVESLERRAGEFEGVVVAEVVTRERHPNADKLSVCRVRDGQGERQIVCGAQNFQAGDKVPLILPGFSLPARPGEKPFAIKVGKIRGVESHGMLCSGFELGLSDDQAGLLVLCPDAVVGQPFAAYLGRSSGDVVFDLEITPNRPDLNSVIGIAREIAAVTGNPLRAPDVRLPDPTPEGGRAAELIRVQLADPELCPRYTARVIRGVRIGPSPDWLRARLELVGLRSINNVVDATNFVMLETGQPLHAFDYHLVAPGNDGVPTIVVRRASAGESFTTLDGQNHRLTADMLLIADPARGIALAGVMGGQNTEISERTVDVLLESAYFKPTNIRRTSKLLGLRTDASYRFERGADLGATEWASRRCAQLILETAGGALAEGVVDAYPAPAPLRSIAVRPAKVNEVLGLSLRPEEIAFYLGQLGLKRSAPKPQPVDAPANMEPAEFQIPSFRVDLKREIDLIEEVARLYGVDRIPATPPRGALGEHAFDTVYDDLQYVRRLLLGFGLDEAQGQTLIGETTAPWITAPLVRLQNPLSADMTVLRPSLLPGLLDSLRHNLSHRTETVALFEVGHTFSQGADQIKETLRLAIALTGPRPPAFWSGADRGATFDAYDLKGLLEEFFEHFGLRALTYRRRTETTPLFVESTAVLLGGKVSLGELGQVQPTLARRYDLRDPVWLAEFDLEQLLARRNTGKTFRALPQFPSIRRDVAMFVPENLAHEAILEAVRQARAAHLERVDLFDVFRGAHVPAGHKSVAYAFTYRHPERTLTDSEVNAAHEQLVASLARSLPVQIRA
jgi:phenylalanyl-tRNA synthetase beta chain